MGSVAPFRLSSFFFGRRAGNEVPLPDVADNDSGGFGSSGGGAAHDAGLREPLLGDADVDLESCHDESFAFSWRRLLLHVG